MTVGELADRMTESPRPVVLDVRWTLAGTDRASFVRGHIPGAVFVDLDRELAASPGRGGRHPLPDLDVLRGLVVRAGIDRGTTVVVTGERDPSIAARAWWLLRWAGLDDVAVLDGGVQAWRSAGLPTVAGDDDPPGGGDDDPPVGGAVDLRPGHLRTVDADGASRYAHGRASVLLDARAAERYRGETEPVDPAPGHIPGAVNLPLPALLGADGRFLPAADLAAVLDEAGARDGAAVAASCGSGVTACMLVLAGAIVGRDFALYPGSYSGWCALGRAVERSAR